MTYTPKELRQRERELAARFGQVEPVVLWGVYHEGCGDEPGLVLIPSADRTPDAVGLFPTKAEAVNAMERLWPGGEVRRVKVTEAPL